LEVAGMKKKNCFAKEIPKQIQYQQLNMTGCQKKKHMSKLTTTHVAQCNYLMCCIKTPCLVLVVSLNSARHSNINVAFTDISTRMLADKPPALH